MIENKRGKITSVSFALMLIISTFAFAYMIGSEVKEVSAVFIDRTTIKQGTNIDGETLYYGIGDDGKVYSYGSSDKVWSSSSFSAEDINGFDSYTGTTSFPDTITGTTTPTWTDPNNGKVYIQQADSDTWKSADGDTTTTGQIAATNKGLISMEEKITLPDGTAAVYNSDTNTYMANGKEYSSDGTLISSGLTTDSDAKASLIGATPVATPNIPEMSETTTYDNGDGTVSWYNANGEKVTIKKDSGETVSKLPPSALFSDPKTKILSAEQARKIVGEENWDKDKTYYQATSGAIYTKGLGDTAIWEGRGEVKTSMFGTWNYGAAQIIDGFTWAAIAGGMVVTLGGFFIKDKQKLNAAAGGIAAGIMAGKLSMAVLGKGGMSDWLGITGDSNVGITTINNQPNKLNWLGRNAGAVSVGIGAATAWLVYNAMWSSEKVTTETVAFNCLPWEAPHGGKDCELCNDETLPCSEYRCKSLGQSCAIVNKGTKEERCVNINPRDSSPPVIKPNNNDLSEGYVYYDIVEMPPGAGFKIKGTNTSTGCIPAYTPIQFGITTNEPSQCKIDIEMKGNYSKMATYFNGENLYKYNHTELLNLPSSADIKNSSITLKYGKELTFYIRCTDAAGNSNEADYALTMCVDPSPDNTAPLIQGTSIENKGCVPADAENATVEFYINEPSECRWDYYDKDYEQMNNNMACSTTAVEINAIQSYTCVTKLNGIARDGTDFYVRCKDQPEGIVDESKRNTNKESYVFNLRGSNQLKLKILKPNETIYGAVRPTPVELYAETLFGCEDNKAVCYYSTTNSANSFVQFFDTDKTDGVHTQRLDLNDGTHTYFVRCVDAGGNVVNASTKFKVSIDVNAPVVARAYEEEGYLKLVTPLNSECVYNTESCDYLFNEGVQMPYVNSTTHVTEWIADKTYFIKCRDEYRSEPVDCSLIVRPTENFLGV